MTDQLHPLTPSVADRLRREILRHKGMEVAILGLLDQAGAVHDLRVLARGRRDAVPALLDSPGVPSLLIHNHPSGLLEPSDADFAVAARLFDMGVGFAIVNNAVTSIVVVVEAPEPRVIKPLTPDAMEALFLPGGPISAAHPAYEDREGQRIMVREVTRAFDESGIAMIEAGTGTGKSIAYLVPAIEWAMQNGERTVVSTGTIHLQEQLVHKDLPLVVRAIDRPVKYALVKGRSNYISIRRALLADAQVGTLFDTGARDELRLLVEWMGKSKDGSRSDLNFEPSPEVWDEVASESDVCMRARCPHFSACFYQKARRDAASADILVANHHLVLSDLALRREAGDGAAILPPYRHLVIDEAHNLEEAATAHFGVRVTRRMLERLLRRLERAPGRGLLAATAADLEVIGDLVADSIAQRIRDDLIEITRRAKLAVDNFYGEVGYLAVAGDNAVRLRDDVPLTEGSRTTLEFLLPDLQALCDGLRSVVDRIDPEGLRVPSLEERRMELAGADRRLRSAVDAIRRVMIEGDNPGATVRWIEAPRPAHPDRPVNYVLAAAPLDVSRLLRAELFEPLASTVLTSATLATRDGLSFLRGRLGLDQDPEGRVREMVIASPFDFRTQTLLAVVTDAPEPRDVGDDDRATDRVADLVGDIALASDGGIFVLFTGWRALKSVAATLRRRRLDLRWDLLVHGERPRSALLAAFRESGRGVLLGTTSFWEGVDVPGRSLRALIIPKLPFQVPTEPVTAARIEAMEEQGENPFTRYQLPLAALRLKQGFGRLVRTATDRGVVVLLDPRLVTRPYGRYFLASLPPAPVVKGAWSEIKPRIDDFFVKGVAVRESEES